MSVVQDIFSLLKSRKQTVSFAESCTGGGISFAISRQPGVSEVFLGSIVSYHSQLKENLLNVDPLLISSASAVNEEVALQMARGARKATGSDWSVATTGVAGPSGGTRQHPVGTVIFAVVGEKFEESKRVQFQGTRAEIQDQAVNEALSWFFEWLSKSK
jgi:nicotinamide-nucleotide amidase